MKRLLQPSSSSLRLAPTVLAIFGWLCATAWLRRFSAPDEGRYTGVALAMLQSGDWLVPRLDGLPFFHKPPLFYWLSAASMSVFGLSEWAARLPSVMGATAAATSLLLFLRRWSEPGIARPATLVLVTMPFLYVGAQFANLDMLVAGCISATVLLAAHARLAREGGAPWRTPLAWAFVAAAAGVLAKGLIGLLLPGIVFVAWAIATRRPDALRLLLWWPGWLLFLGLSLPWFAAMQWRYPGFCDYFVVTQHFRRFAATGFNNAQPLWFYLPVIAGLTLPWVAWLPWAARRRPARAASADIDGLMLVWFVTIIVFFSIPRSKLIGYVLPALPPLAYFVARAMARTWPAARGLGKPAAWTAGLAALSCVLAVLAADRFGTPAGARLRLPAGLSVGAQDQVLMLDDYRYEIPFYWQLRQPMLVASDWSDPGLPLRDNWRKELSDAARFDPAAAGRILVPARQVAAALCVPRVSWLLGSPAAASAWPWLADRRRFVEVAREKDLVAWRFAGAPANGTPCDLPAGAAPPGEAAP